MKYRYLNKLMLMASFFTMSGEQLINAMEKFENRSIGEQPVKVPMPNFAAFGASAPGSGPKLQISNQSDQQIKAWMVRGGEVSQPIKVAPEQDSKQLNTAAHFYMFLETSEGLYLLTSTFDYVTLFKATGRSIPLKEFQALDTPALVIINPDGKVDFVKKLPVSK